MQLAAGGRVAPADGGTAVASGAIAGRLVERWVPGSLAAGPGSARRRRLAVPAALVGVVAAVLTSVVLLGGKPAAESPPLLPPAKTLVATAAAEGERPQVPTLVVSVIGKVAKPGLVTVPSGSRVADALQAVGGPLAGTDLLGLNLARRLADGEQLAVGVPVPAVDSAQLPASSPPAKVNLNAASLEQLDTLPGVGQVTAKRIVEWRTRHGSFSRIEQLRDIDGIGDNKFTKLRDQVTVR
jgi:competence protein ComEA